MVRSFLPSALLLLTLGCVQDVLAQATVLEGVVTIQNSRRESGQKAYVADARVRAMQAMPAVSDGQGRFRLTFSGLESGASVRLMIEKQGLSVVNARDLAGIVLGRTEPLYVVMADAQKLAQLQEDYYEVTRTGVERGFTERMATLRNENVALSERLKAIEFGHLSDSLDLGSAIERLTVQRDKALEHAGVLAREFAQVDLDEVSDTYLQAFACFQRGDPDSTIMLLDPQRLSKAQDEALLLRKKGRGSIASANAAFRQLKESMQLKVGVLESRLRFQEARQVMDAIGKLIADQPDAFDVAVPIAYGLSSSQLWSRLGNEKQAIAALDDALTKAERDLPEKHPLVVDLWLQRGSWFLGREASDSALVCLQKALALARNEQSADSAKVTLALVGLCSAFDQKGEYGTAVARGRAAVVLAELDSTQSPDMLAFALSALGHALMGSGHPEEAVVVARRGYGLRGMITTQGDPRWFAEALYMADILESTGQLTEALSIRLKALEMVRATLGPDHPNTGLALYAIARIEQLKGAIPESLQHADTALAILRSSVGEDHVFTATLHSMMAVLFGLQTKADPALMHMRMCLATSRRIYPVDHPGRNKFLGLMSDVLKQIGQLDSAQYYAQLYLEGSLRVYGPVHDEVASAQEGLGDIAGATRRYRDAVLHYQQALGLFIQVRGPTSSRVARVHNILGMAFCYAGQLDSGLYHYEQSMAIYGTQLSPDDPTMVQGRIRMIWCEVDLGRSDTALSHAEHLLPITIKKWGEPGGMVGSLRTAMGRALEDKGDLKAALEQFSHAAWNYEKKVGSKGYNNARAYYLMGRVQYKLGDTGTARQFLDSSLTVLSSRDAHWHLYLLERKEGLSGKAIEHLAACLRSEQWEYGSLPVDMVEQRSALKNLAKAAGRLDILSEFHLE